MAAIEKRSRKDWQELDRDHHLHPFTDHKALHEKRSRIITRAEGSYIFDADGNRILDGMSGLWCVNVGYGQQSLIDAATQRRSSRRSASRNSIACSSRVPVPSLTTPWCAWCAPTGT
jgi:putrescine aminotransferase